MGNHLFILLSGMLVLLLSSCYSPVDGCTDIYALNYDASADEHCCCNYPSVRYTNDLIVDSVRYNKDTIFYDINERPFYINKFILAAHDIQLDGSTSMTFPDTIELSDAQDVIFPKIVILDSKSQIYDLKELRDLAIIKSQNMKIGMPTEINRISYDKIPTSNILDKYEILYDTIENKWYDGVIDIYPDTSSDKTYRIYLEDIEITISGELLYRNEIGGNVTLLSEMNLSTIFVNFDLNDTKKVQADHITNRLSQSFYFIE